MKTRRLIDTLFIGLLATAAIGCVGNLPETRHGRAAGEWRVQLPSTPSTLSGLAFGTGGNSQPAVISEPNAPQLLAANTRAAKPHPQTRAKPHNVPAAQMVAAVPERIAAPATSQPTPTEQLAKPEAAPALLASNSQPGAEQRYAQREAQSQKLQDFRGGDAIVISAGALVVVLLIVILVLLLR